MIIIVLYTMYDIHGELSAAHWVFIKIINPPDNLHSVFRLSDFRTRHVHVFNFQFRHFTYRIGPE